MAVTTSVPRSWPPWLILGPLFMLAGGVIGYGWRDAPEHRVPAQSAWSPPTGTADRPMRRERAVGMPSLAPIVDGIRGGVVGIHTIHARGPEGLDGGSGDGAGHGGASETATGSYGVSHGTGFVVREDGLILTAHHLVADPDTILIEFPELGRREGEIVGEDPHTDLAFVRATEPLDRVFALELGDSDAVKQGDWVLTLGNPLRFPLSVGVGVVSFVGRHLMQDGMQATSDHMQFTAPANPGTSGSPVVDMQGRVVGITTRAAVDAQGLSFAIPTRVIAAVMRSMEQHDGRVRRAYLGIEFQRAERHLTRPFNIDGAGVLVIEVRPGQPAALAGLRAGDILLSADGRAIEDALEFHDLVTWSLPGSTVRLEVVRDGERIGSIDVVYGELDTPGKALSH